jgi:hypothetical protein
MPALALLDRPETNYTKQFEVEPKLATGGEGNEPPKTPTKLTLVSAGEPPERMSFIPTPDALNREAVHAGEFALHDTVAFQPSPQPTPGDPRLN